MTTTESPITGTEGFRQFNELSKKIQPYRQLLSRSQKVQLAALRRSATKHDYLSDWRPLIDRLFQIWEAALGTNLRS